MSHHDSKKTNASLVRPLSYLSVSMIFDGGVSIRPPEFEEMPRPVQTVGSGIKICWDRRINEELL